MCSDIIVTSWYEADVNDFCLSKDWLSEQGIKGKEATATRKLAKDGKLYEAYLVNAVQYCVYSQMDAQYVLIDDDGSVIVEGEAAVIGNDFEDKLEVA